MTDGGNHPKSKRRLDQIGWPLCLVALLAGILGRVVLGPDVVPYLLGVAAPFLGVAVYLDRIISQKTSSKLDPFLPVTAAGLRVAGPYYLCAASLIAVAVGWPFIELH